MVDAGTQPDLRMEFAIECGVEAVGRRGDKGFDLAVGRGRPPLRQRTGGLPSNIDDILVVDDQVDQTPVQCLLRTDLLAEKQQSTARSAPRRCTRE